jgi:hypothetical protein
VIDAGGESPAAIPIGFGVSRMLLPHFLISPMAVV